MSNKPEHFLERGARILGGWGVAIGILAFDWGHDWPWAVGVGVAVFAISMAHSTVAGIVLGSLGRAYRILRPRSDVAPGLNSTDFEPPVGTTVIEPPKVKGKRTTRT